MKSSGNWAKNNIFHKDSENQKLFQLNSNLLEIFYHPFISKSQDRINWNIVRTLRSVMTAIFDFSCIPLVRACYRLYGSIVRRIPDRISRDVTSAPYLSAAQTTLTQLHGTDSD